MILQIICWFTKGFRIWLYNSFIGIELHKDSVLALILGDPSFKTYMLFATIFGGAMLWWLFITYVVNKLRARFDVRGIWIINRIIGSAVMIGSIVGAALIATGVFSFH